MYNIHLSTILINDNIEIVSYSGEPFVRLQLGLKEEIHEAGGFFVWLHLYSDDLAE